MVVDLRHRGLSFRDIFTATPSNTLRLKHPFMASSEILAGIIKATDQRALVIQTMYSPFMQACTSVGRDRLRQHIMHDASAVCEGMARITESMRAFVQACIALGVDGFYASTQGGDESMFADSPLFERCIKPYDLELMREMDRQCRFNILHICDYWSGYRNLDAFVDYPGHVVSKPHHVQNGESPIDDHLFHRPLMGGLDRHGVIATGPVSEIENEVRAVIERAPRQFILGADCTLPSDVSWDHIRRAIDTAHTA